MAGFLGAKVQLILNQPPNTEVHGTVQDIVAGQTLSLVNVYFPSTGAVLDALTVQSASIVDVKILPNPQPFIPPPVERRVDTVLGTRADHTPVEVSSSSNIDPAILSYDRAPYRPPPQQQPVEAPASLPIRLTQAKKEQASTLGPAPDENGKKRQRRPKQRLPDPSLEPSELAPVIDIEVSRNGNAMNNTVKRGKGWRQTPLLQPTQSSAKPGKRSRKQRQAAEGDAQNGWATEDATDIQDMGEFDFEANHKLFDKQQVFDDLRKGDTTADEDRLVGHNRVIPRKNLLPSENVLSPKLEVDDKGSDADTEIDFATGRSSSRHSLARRQQSRQNSHQHDPKSGPAPSIARSATTNSRTGRPLPLPATSTLKAGRSFSPHSITSSSATKRTNGRRADRASPAPPVSGLTITLTNTICPTLHPSALELLEKEACSRYGLLVEAVIENAARGIAEQAVSMIISPAEIRRGSRATTSKPGMSSSAHGFDNVPPVIVVLAGNHITGSRAIAAARHLSSRGYKIIIAEGQFALAAHDQDDHYAKQLATVKKMMRSGANIKRGSWSKANAYIKNLNGPPVLILDALLAGARHEDVLDGGQEAEAGSEDVRKMIDWANRSRAPVLSVTCPSGLSDHDGSATIVDGEPLAVRADKLLALGAPVTGVLEALKAGEHFDISLADIGINIALKSDDAVNFGSQWLASLTFTTSDHDIEE